MIASGAIQERGLLSPDGKLARRWPLWVLAALSLYSFEVIVVVTAMAQPQSATWAWAGALAFVLSCAAASVADGASACAS